MIHAAGGRREDEEALRLAAEAVAQVDAAAVAETRERLAGLGVEGEEVLSRAEDDAPLGAVAPDDDPAVHAERVLLGAGGEGVEAPELAAGGRVERERLQLGARAVEDAVDDHRVALDLRPAVGPRVRGVVRPGHLELRDVRRVDLRERRMLCVPGVPPVPAPLALRGHGRAARRRPGGARRLRLRLRRRDVREGQGGCDKRNGESRHDEWRAGAEEHGPEGYDSAVRRMAHRPRAPTTGEADRGMMPFGRAPVAQLDRATGFEPVGREFDSLRARQSS